MTRITDATALCIRLVVRTQMIRDRSIRRGEMVEYIPARRVHAIVAEPLPGCGWRSTLAPAP